MHEQGVVTGNAGICDHDVNFLIRGGRGGFLEQVHLVGPLRHVAFDERNLAADHSVLSLHSVLSGDILRMFLDKSFAVRHIEIPDNHIHPECEISTIVKGLRAACCAYREWVLTQLWPKLSCILHQCHWRLTYGQPCS